MCGQTYTHIRTYAHTHIRTYAHAHTHIRTRTYAHTHIRTRTIVASNSRCNCLLTGIRQHGRDKHMRKMDHAASTSLNTGRNVFIRTGQTDIMYGQIVEKITELKRAFARGYHGGAYMQEILPVAPSKSLPISAEHLWMLHRFVKENPIYHNSFEQEICSTCCIAYEGDINDYLLDSMKHGSSCQPFYPTWMISAFMLAYMAKECGCQELIDIGSGDGRIAFCGSLLGMHSRSIEIDDSLIELQKRLCVLTGIDFGPACEDALELDYAGMDLSGVVFFVGGLPQMGGDVLVENLLQKINVLACGGTPWTIVLAGAGAQSGPAASRQADSAHRHDAHGGWGTLLDRYGLSVIGKTSLPTVWTFDQDEETPYIYARPSTSKI